MSTLPVLSALTAALVALLLTALSLNVSRLRIHHRVSFGDGGHKALEVASRAHGNALEQGLLFLLLMVLAELCGAPATGLAGNAALFLVARLAHVSGVFGRQLRLRQLAHLTTLATQLALAAWLLWHLPARTPWA